LAVEASTRPEALHLGKSEKGVHCALVDESNQTWQIRVWTLKKQDYDYQIDGPRILSDIYYRRRCGKGGETVVQDRVAEDYYDEFIDFLGFHPYKEVVFLSESSTTGVAYHLNSSKVQELGFFISYKLQRRCFPRSTHKTVLPVHTMLDGRVSPQVNDLSCFEGCQLMVESDSILEHKAC
jgi:hypothetical protein